MYRGNTSSSSRSQSIARIALTIALMAVSAWVSIPIGPVPFTLQCFAVAFALCVLPAKECICSVTGYVVLGAFGVPVFSGMRGGISVLAGVTGGFLWGYLVGILAGLAFLAVFDKQEKPRTLPVCLGACVLYLVCTYACGTLQFALVAGSSVQAALAVCVVPFIIPDVIKLVAAASAARAVRAALGMKRAGSR